MHQVSACCRYSLKYQWSGSIACTITVVDMSHVTGNTKFVVTVVSHVASCSEGHTQESIGCITVQCCSQYAHVRGPVITCSCTSALYACTLLRGACERDTVLFYCHPPYHTVQNIQKLLKMCTVGLEIFVVEIFCCITI